MNLVKVIEKDFLFFWCLVEKTISECAKMIYNNFTAEHSTKRS